MANSKLKGNDCDWLKHAKTCFALKITFSLKIKKAMCGKLTDSLSSKVIKQIKKPLTVLCCVVNLLARKRLENSKSKEKHRKKSNVSPYSSFVLYPLPVRFTTKTEHSQGFFIC